MSENELSSYCRRLLSNPYKLGPGLFKSVYEEILNHELKSKGLLIERQKGIPVYWNGLRMEQEFRANLIANEKVLIEIKSVERLS